MQPTILNLKGGVGEDFEHAIGKIQCRAILVEVEEGQRRAAPEAVQAGVLIASVAGGFATLFDVGQIHARLRMGALHDGRQSQVIERFQRSAAVGQGTQAADRSIDGRSVIVVQDPAIGVGHAGRAAVVGAAGSKE